MSCLPRLLHHCSNYLVRFIVLLAVALLAGSAQLSAPVQAQTPAGKILFTSNRDRTAGGPSLGTGPTSM